MGFDRPLRRARHAGGAALLAALLAAAAAGAVFAGEAPAGGADVARLYFAFQAGVASMPEIPDMPQRGTPTAVGGKWGLQSNLHLAFEFEFISAYSDVWAPPPPAPPGTEYQDHRSLDIGGFAVSVRAMAPVWRLQPYAQAGFGIFRGRMRLRGFAGFLYLPAEITKDVISPAPVVALGTNLLVGRRTFVGGEIKHVFLRQDYAELSDGTIDVGGTSFLFTLGCLVDMP